MGKRLYIGKNAAGPSKGLYTAFWSDKVPTEASHGGRFSIAEGPFRSRQAADDRASYMNSWTRKAGSEAKP